MKATRQEKIIELISKYDVETQEDLARLLNREGYNVTQATVSRDIKALKLEKVPSGTKSKYIYPENKVADRNKYLSIFKDGYASIAQAANLVVIKTASGMAMAVAAALDHLNLDEVVGTIAGDDTIMCATRSEEEAARLISRIREMMKSS